MYTNNFQSFSTILLLKMVYKILSLSGPKYFHRVTLLDINCHMLKANLPQSRYKNDNYRKMLL